MFNGHTLVITKDGSLYERKERETGWNARMLLQVVALAAVSAIFFATAFKSAVDLYVGWSLEDYKLMFNGLGYLILCIMAIPVEAKIASYLLYVGRDLRTRKQPQQNQPRPQQNRPHVPPGVNQNRHQQGHHHQQHGRPAQLMTAK